MAKPISRKVKGIFTTTEVGVLFEDIGHKLGYIAEGLDTPRMWVDKLERKLEATFEVIGELKVEAVAI
jgi:hypothetical protein